MKERLFALNFSFIISVTLTMYYFVFLKKLKAVLVGGENSCGLAMHLCFFLFTSKHNEVCDGTGATPGSGRSQNGAFLCGLFR